MNIPQLDNTYIANTYARFPVTIARGKGSLVWDLLHLAVLLLFV